MHFSNDENHQIDAWDEHLDPGYVSQDIIRNQIEQQNHLSNQKSRFPETVDSGDHLHGPERRPLQNRVSFQRPQPFLYKIRQMLKTLTLVVVLFVGLLGTSFVCRGPLEPQRALVCRLLIASFSRFSPTRPGLDPLDKPHLKRPIPRLTPPTILHDSTVKGTRIPTENLLDDYPVERLNDSLYQTTLAAPLYTPADKPLTRDTSFPHIQKNSSKGKWGFSLTLTLDPSRLFEPFPRNRHPDCDLWSADAILNFAQTIANRVVSVQKEELLAKRKATTDFIKKQNHARAHKFLQPAQEEWEPSTRIEPGCGSHFRPKVKPLALVLGDQKNPEVPQPSLEILPSSSRAAEPEYATPMTESLTSTPELQSPHLTDGSDTESEHMAFVRRRVGQGIYIGLKAVKIQCQWTWTPKSP